MNSKIVVIGSCNIDLQCFTPRLPRPGETLHGTEFRKGFGGKGANQCVAAAKLGSSTAMIARLGNDSFGQEFHRALKDNKINTDYVLMTDGVSSGLALITVAQNGIAIVNAAPAVTNPDPLVFRLSDIFCVNESEAEVLTGMAVQSVDEAKVAVGLLLDKGCKQGAGDMFVGGLAFYLAYYPQLPMREIVKRSCEVATVSVQNYGTQTSFPTKDDLPTELFL
ncbi:ribokinase isoform X2 [Cryptotermes secundus]|uniref:ribokinase isoform X2 n=1 Tax=Cryptotermes secundus TaxID=105785 RepID=UPI000CD7C888|nr:ribokinase isoform X2 [Cryptotermes secundus]